jgi:hypothetical protein
MGNSETNRQLLISKPQGRHAARGDYAGRSLAFVEERGGGGGWYGAHLSFGHMVRCRGGEAKLLHKKARLQNADFFGGLKWKEILLLLKVSRRAFS